MFFTKQEDTRSMTSVGEFFKWLQESKVEDIDLIDGIVIYSDDSLEKCLEILSTHKVRAAPVFDRSKKIFTGKNINYAYQKQQKVDKKISNFVKPTEKKIVFSQKYLAARIIL